MTLFPDSLLQGHPALVTNLARFFGKLLGQELDPMTNVLVTVGAYEALFCCFQALVDEGDEVIKDSPSVAQLNPDRCTCSDPTILWNLKEAGGSYSFMEAPWPLRKGCSPVSVCMGQPGILVQTLPLEQDTQTHVSVDPCPLQSSAVTLSH